MQKHVVIETSKGTIKLRLNGDKTPNTVENFLQYVDAGYYEGTVFHRVIDGFMIQGGGMDAELTSKPSKRSAIENEADRGGSNKLGTIAMARTNDPHSATSQFFINVKDNTFLDYQSSTPSGWGYCVFGEVIEGMDVVNAIKCVPTGAKNGHQDVPLEPITLLSASVVDPQHVE